MFPEFLQSYLYRILGNFGALDMLAILVDDENSLKMTALKFLFI